MPLLKELSRTSRDSFRLDGDSKESSDDWLDSFKNGVLYFYDSIDSISISIGSILRPEVVVNRPGHLASGGVESLSCSANGEHTVKNSTSTSDWQIRHSLCLIVRPIRHRQHLICKLL